MGARVVAVSSRAAWRAVWVVALGAELVWPGCTEPRHHPIGGTGGSIAAGANAATESAKGSTGTDASVDVPTAARGGSSLGTGGSGTGGSGTGGSGTGGSGTGGNPSGGARGSGGAVGSSGSGGAGPGIGGSGNASGANGSGGSLSCTPTCVPGATCHAGSCVCVTDGQTLCPDACADLQADRNHCGSCSNTCPGRCSAARCFTTLTTTPYDEMHIAVNADRVFFTMNNAGTVSWVLRTGGSVRVIAAFQNRPMGIAIDSNYVYWVNQGAGNEGSVMKMPLFGGSPETLAASEPYPQDMAVDATNVYWNNCAGAGSIMKVPIAGGTKVTLASGPSIVGSCAMTIDGTNAYWTNQGDAPDTNTGSVMKVPLGGGTITTLASNVDMPASIGVFNSTVFFTTNGPAALSVKKVSAAGGTVSTILPTTWATALAVDATGLFLGLSNSTIVQLPLTGTNMTTLAQLGSQISHLALDANNVFWSAQGVEMGFTAKEP